MAIRLQDIRAAGDPLRQYNHELVIPDIPNGGNGETLRLLLLNTSIPGFGSEPFESAHFGHITKHAGRLTHPRVLTAEYEENVSLTVYKALKAWHSLQWEPNTGIQTTADLYKTDGKLLLKDGSKNTVGTIGIIGMFIEDVGDTPIDGATSDAVRVSVTFSYDELDLSKI